MYLHLSLMYPSCAAQRRFSIDFGALGTWKKPQKMPYSRRISRFSQFRKGSPKEVQKAPKSDPRESQIDPRSGQERPRRPQEPPGEAPRAAQEPPGAPQAHPRTAQIRFPSGLDGPPVTQSLSGGLQEAILDPHRGDFPPSGGQYSHTFPPSGQHLQNCPLRKAYASIRSASLDVLV